MQIPKPLGSSPNMAKNDEPNCMYAFRVLSKTTTQSIFYIFCTLFPGWCWSSFVLVWAPKWRMVNNKFLRDYGSLGQRLACSRSRMILSSHVYSTMFALKRELLYSPEDITRSSPFFWAFRKAFPDQSDQIFGITDAIPPPIKEVGPAFQTISLEASQTGKFVSRVKVATLNGMATSIMTTRGTIAGIDGVDGIKIQVDTTKPEESTALKTLMGPFGALINESVPPFPSGQVSKCTGC